MPIPISRRRIGPRHDDAAFNLEMNVDRLVRPVPRRDVEAGLDRDDVRAFPAMPAEADAAAGAGLVSIERAALLPQQDASATDTGVPSSSPTHSCCNDETGAPASPSAAFATRVGAARTATLAARVTMVQDRRIRRHRGCGSLQSSCRPERPRRSRCVSERATIQLWKIARKRCASYDGRGGRGRDGAIIPRRIHGARRHRL